MDTVIDVAIVAYVVLTVWVVLSTLVRAAVE